MTWHATRLMDTGRINHCRIRLVCGTELKGFWGTSGARHQWACSDGKLRELRDVEQIEVLRSLPRGSLPGGRCTDAELLADSLCWHG